MDLKKLEKFLQENNQPKFRLGQIQKAIFKDGISSFSEITTLSKDLREVLEKEMKILSFNVEKVLASKDGKSIKALLKCGNAQGRDAINRVSTGDDFIETVLLSPRPNTWTVCISSQIGCPLKCEFCATGKMVFKRNLTAEEITDQVLFWRQYLKARSQKLEASDVSNIVFMGMGEPFLNWKEVKKSVEDLINPKMFEFGSRSVSISTAGVPGGIEKFLEEFPQVNLAVSLHFADNEMRSRYMPANKAYDLEKIKETLKNYFKKSKRKIFIEYIMFDGLNDTIEDAKKLAQYLNSIGNSYLLHVNLISYNETSGKFKSSSKNKIENFKSYLLQNKINATVRKSLGEEIQGACGQLIASGS